MNKKISWFILGVALFISVTGCAAAKQQYEKQKQAFDACLAQTEPGGCAEKAEAWKKKGQVAGELIATGVATVVPGAAVAVKPASQGFGYLLFGIAAIILGHGVIAEQHKPPVPPPTT